ncbi:hypothetical protein [Parasaccharibacter apium]|uniref:hypothetical protein n=1 Tax=Parasaccharibacter apium TaxID=1510841 RepID=UPI0012EBC5BF|nr:hypothetical protein [Parasaccharibacter apium]
MNYNASDYVKKLFKSPELEELSKKEKYFHFELNKIRDKFLKGDENAQCMHDFCSQKAIKSHSFSEYIIKGIEKKEDKLLTPNYDPSSKKFTMLPTATSEAGTFRGFCREHDINLFKEIENIKVDNKILEINSPKYSTIQTYRILCREIKFMLSEIKAHFYTLDEYISNTSKRIENIIEKKILSDSAIKNLGKDDMNLTNILINRKKYDLINTRYWQAMTTIIQRRMFLIEKIEKLRIIKNKIRKRIFDSKFSYEYNDDGIKLTAREVNIISPILLSFWISQEYTNNPILIYIISNQEKSWIVFCYKNEDYDTFRSILEKEEDDLLTFIYKQIGKGYVGNFFASEKFIQTHPEIKENLEKNFHNPNA